MNAALGALHSVGQRHNSSNIFDDAGPPSLLSIMILRDVFHRSSGEVRGTWLFLPGKREDWTLETEAFLLDPDALDRDPDTDEPIFSPELAAKNLREVLDAGTVAECIKWADKLTGTPNDAVRLESLLYYYRFDAPLPQVGAPEPPPWEETQRRLDQEFYESLGPENPAQKCKREGCDRGVVRYSVLCKRHHFESIQRRECPFSH